MPTKIKDDKILDPFQPGDWDTFPGPASVCDDPRVPYKCAGDVMPGLDKRPGPRPPWAVKSSEPCLMKVNIWDDVRFKGSGNKNMPDKIPGPKPEYGDVDFFILSRV